MIKFLIFTVIFFVLIFLLIYSGSIYSLLSKVEKITFNSELGKKHLQNSSSEKKIILVHVEKAFSGGEIHELSLYKELIDRGVNVDLLIAKDSRMAQECDKEQVPYYTSNALKFNAFKFLYRKLLVPQIKSLCKDSNNCIVHVHAERALWSAQEVAKDISVKVMLTRHVPTHFKHPEYLKNIDGVVGVSTNIENYVRSLSKETALGVKKVITATPLFVQEEFINFKTNKSAKQFFKEEFDVEIGDCPKIVLIGDLTSDDRKNHKMTIKTVSRLIKDHGFKVELILAGVSDKNNQKLRTLCKDLSISEYVHILPFNNKISDILYHSDINVLPSWEEGCGIVLLEGALMNKALITTAGQGGEAIVMHGKTGLLCKNNDEDDFLKQLLYLLKKPSLAKELGDNAREHVLNNLTRKRITDKLIAFYNKTWDR